MKKRTATVASIFLIVLMLMIETSVVLGALSLKSVQTWYWTDRTYIWSVARGDVDGDGKVEIVTGGQYDNGPSLVAQLCVWNGATLAFENVRTWCWGESATYISSIAVDDVDGDKEIEIITGGYYWDGTKNIAQLCVWNGKTLTLENVKTWYWTDNTVINAVAVADVDGDGELEIITGGYCNDIARYQAQLCVWSGSSLALEDVKTWYWASSTFITSVAVGDVNDDGKPEIVTGGYYYDGPRIAQLCVWNGASLTFNNVQTWCWTSDTEINSVGIGDVDKDKQMEIVTGGNNYDGSQRYAQLCVWDGATLKFEDSKTWYWTSHTYLESVATGDVTGDGELEIITGGYFYSGGFYAQLCVWDGEVLKLEDVTTWRWISNTRIESVAVGNVDGDVSLQILAGGYYNDGIREVAQLTVWK
jgi:hypothetical protein